LKLREFAVPFTITGYVLLNILSAKLIPATRSALRLIPGALRGRWLNPLLSRHSHSGVS
jgi:hypothetical protein